MIVNLLVYIIQIFIEKRIENKAVFHEKPAYCKTVNVLMFIGFVVGVLGFNQNIKYM